MEVKTVDTPTIRFASAGITHLCRHEQDPQKFAEGIRGALKLLRGEDNGGI